MERIWWRHHPPGIPAEIDVHEFVSLKDMRWRTLPTPLQEVLEANPALNLAVITTESGTARGASSAQPRRKQRSVRRGGKSVPLTQSLEEYQRATPLKIYSQP